jgi:hypothetical protein
MRALILEANGWEALVEVEWLPTPHRTHRVVSMSTLSLWTFQDDEYWHNVREQQREAKAREAEYLKRMAILDAKRVKYANSSRNEESVPARLGRPLAVCPLFEGEGEV